MKNSKKCLLALLLLSVELGLAPAAVAAPNTFTATGNLTTYRTGGHTATLLQNGKVLVAAGYIFDNGGGVSNTAELFDPATGKWTSTGSLSARAAHTATLLRNGKVLVVGGYVDDFFGGPPTYLTTAQLYDPASGSWSSTGNLVTARGGHTATLLPNGKVLVVGGLGAGNAYLRSAELFDPVAGTWSGAGSMGIERSQHTATMLPNGKVLVAGGRASSSNILGTAELYDVASGVWSSTQGLGSPRTAHTASLLPNGFVLVAGGSSGGYLATAQLYNPASGTWSNTGSMSAARGFHSATVLPNGRVLVAGGADGLTLATAQIYEPTNGTWSAAGNMTKNRWGHTATVLPSGGVLMAGGHGTDSSTAELFDPATPDGDWTSSLSSAGARLAHTATLLPSGKVLVYGGYYGIGYRGTTEVYTPATETWAPGGPAGVARASHTATLLPNGKVLAAGGFDPNGTLFSAHLWDPASGGFAATGNFAFGAPRANHTATLLPDGRVLVAGGQNQNTYLGTAQLYGFVSGSWSLTGNMGVARNGHTATLLPNGKVLVAGGQSAPLTTAYLSSAELYDPATGTWSSTGSMSVARSRHTATLLPSGKVLVTAGRNHNGTALTSLATVELYDPATGAWSSTGSLAVARTGHTTTLLPGGRVVVLGGGNGGAELYDPATGLWKGADTINERSNHTATLLPNGKVLVAAGYAPAETDPHSPYSRTAMLYDLGLGFVRPEWQPQITGSNSTLWSGHHLSLFGSRFRGVAQASGGNTQDSSTSYPVVQLRSLESGQTRWLPLDPGLGWSDTSFTSSPVTGFPSGPALMTMFANGIQSDSKFLTVASLNIVSRKTHNGVPYDISLPVNGPVGIECRSGGASNAHQIVFQFGVPVTFANVTATAELDGYPVTSPDGKEVAVNLKNVSNAQMLWVTLLDVNDGTGESDVSAQTGILLGDTNGNGSVNASDIGQAKAQSGAPVTTANFRTDVNVNGSINASDIGLVKSRSGQSLP